MRIAAARLEVGLADRPLAEQWERSALFTAANESVTPPREERRRRALDPACPRSRRVCRPL